MDRVFDLYEILRGRRIRKFYALAILAWAWLDPHGYLTAAQQWEMRQLRPAIAAVQRIAHPTPTSVSTPRRP
jgi:hypothetical protein